MRPQHEVDGLLAVADSARMETEAGLEYALLGGLRVEVGTEIRAMDAVLDPNGVGGYATRLYLPAPIPERAQTVNGMPANWTQRTLFGRTWWTWSWRDVNRDQPLIVILRQHLKALR